MKKNSGFVLFETLIVSTLVLGTLIFLFIQLSSLKESYNKSFKYDTIPNLYKLSALSNYLEETGYKFLQTSIDNSNYGYIDLKQNCVSIGYLCESLIEKANINNILITNNDITTLKANLTNIDFSETFKQYIKKLPNTKDANNNRLIAEFNDNTYGSIVMNIETSDLSSYILTNLVSNGSFEENLTDWTNVGTMETTTNLKKNGNYSLNINQGSINQDITLENNHYYFFYADLYTANTINNNNYLKIFNNDNEYVLKTFDNLMVRKWNNFSTIFKSVSTTATISFNFLDNLDVNIDSVMLVDVTNLFENDEPNINWCQKNIKYIQNTGIIYK